MEAVSTKQRILAEALTLFAERGYDGASIDMIAEMAGIKGPSLYRHFRSKEEILDALIEQGEMHYEKNFGSQANLGRIPCDMEELTAVTKQRISFTMHDGMIRKYRRIMATEQFRSEKVAKLATRHNMNGLTDMFSLIFKGMMDAGAMRREDTYLCALQFVAPVTLMLQAYDRQPEMEAELTETIDRHLAHFAKVYGVQKEG